MLLIVRTLWVPLVCVLLSLAGCQSEPPSRLELRRTHYVLPPPTEPAPLDPARQMVLEAEWPAPYTVMRPFADDVIRVRQNRWVACDASGRSYRLETACDEGVVRVRPGHCSPRVLAAPCDATVYRGPAHSAAREPCYRRSFGYGAPVVVRVPRWQRRAGPPRVVVYSAR